MHIEATIDKNGRASSRMHHIEVVSIIAREPVGGIKRYKTPYLGPGPGFICCEVESSTYLLMREG